MNKLSKTSLFCLFFILSAVLSGMQSNRSESRKEEPKKIYMEHADSTEFREENNPDVWVAKGNVVFRHDSTYLYCDSAYLYNTDNSLEAFSNVVIEQGDTLFIYGDYLMYEGNNNLAKMRENVRMENNDVTLFTDNLNYDRNQNMGYYFDGGMLVDSLNELTSIYGQYSPETRIATFKEEVTLLNPQFTLDSDTLKYNTVTRVATILGQTQIESDSGTVYSTRGIYATLTDESTLYDRSLVTSKDGTKTITADTLFYNRQTGFAEAFGNMLLNDTVKKAMLTGHYGYYDELKNFAFAADSAQFIECSQADTLFLHADTLQMKTIGDDRIVDAYYGVRFFREDIQGVCDSMHYDTRESMLYMLRNPVMWNTGYQISGDTVKILFNDSTLNKFLVRDRAFAMEEIDSTYCNQIKGRFLTGYFDDGKLSRVEIEGATESIYYPIEEKKMEFIGRNKTESTYMTIFVKDGKIREIRWKPEPKGEMLPLPDLTPEQKFLNEFVNFNYLRPKNKDDIFTVIPMKTEDTPAQKRRIRQIIN